MNPYILQLVDDLLRVVVERYLFPLEASPERGPAVPACVATIIPGSVLVATPDGMDYLKAILSLHRPAHYKKTLHEVIKLVKEIRQNPSEQRLQEAHALSSAMQAVTVKIPAECEWVELPQQTSWRYVWLSAYPVQLQYTHAAILKNPHDRAMEIVQLFSAGEFLTRIVLSDSPYQPAKLRETIRKREEHLPLLKEFCLSRLKDVLHITKLTGQWNTRTALTLTKLSAPCVMELLGKDVSWVEEPLLKIAEHVVSTMNPAQIPSTSESWLARTLGQSPFRYHRMLATLLSLPALASGRVCRVDIPFFMKIAEKYPDTFREAAAAILGARSA